jgi:hypothetical protein
MPEDAVSTSNKYSYTAFENESIEKINDTATATTNMVATARQGFEDMFFSASLKVT